MKQFKAMVSLFAVVMTGCYSTYDPYYYDYTYYDPYWYGYDAYYTYGWVDPYGVYYFSDLGAMQSPDLNAAATAIANRASTYFTPTGCVVATASGPKVSYNFNNCDGPFGLTSVSGTLQLGLSQNNGQLVLTATSSDLTAGGHPFMLDMTATATRTGTQRSVTVTSHSHSPELADSRDAQFTMNWEQGSGCVTLDGQSNASRGNLSTSSTVTGYQRCVDQCPSAGKVEVTTNSGVFTTQFNGSSKIEVTAPDGNKKSYDLHCP